MDGATIALDDIGAHPLAIAAIHRLWTGAAVTETNSLHCIVPRHNGRATLYLDERLDADLDTGDQPRRDVWKYACWCFGQPQFLALAEAHASRAAGQIVRLAGRQRLVWWRRLGFDAGLLAPLHVRLPLIAGTEPEHVHRVAAGFGLLVGLRWLDEPDVPTAYGREFAGPWCAIGKVRAGQAIRRLRELGTIVPTGNDDSRRWPIPLYLPGHGQR